MEFLLKIKAGNSKLIQVKKNFIFLLQGIPQEGLIRNQIEIIPKHKNASVKYLKINQLELKHLNRRVAYLVFYEDKKIIN